LIVADPECAKVKFNTFFAMAEREQLTTTLDQILIEQLKTLAIYEKRTVNKLLEEAVSDLLKKYTEKWFKK
jgi:hypothetical protein